LAADDENHIPGFTPVPEANVVLVSTCDFDTEEKRLLEQSDIALVTTKSVREKGIREALKPSLEALQTRVPGAYLHIDLDVLDPNYAQVSESWNVWCRSSPNISL